MNPTAAPPRTLDQRMEALMLAQAIRRRRAVLKRKLKAGEDDARFILAKPPEWAATMRVRDLLLAVPRMGPVKVDALMKRAQVAPGKTLGGITERQRLELIERLGR